MTNYASLVNWASARHPDRPAIKFETATITYRELDRSVRQMAQVLRSRGLVRGDRVALMAGNCPLFIIAFWGAIRAGCVVVPMNPLLREREIDHHLMDSGAKAFIHSETALQEAAAAAASAGVGVRWTIRDRTADVTIPATDLAAALRSMPGQTRNSDELEPTSAGDPAVLLYTSGTTGQPKGAVLTHANLTCNVAVFSTTCLGITADDVVFGALPLFHSFGQTLGMGGAFAAGACLCLLERFTPDTALELIADHQVTIMLGVPTMYIAILQAASGLPDALATLRICLSGGAAAPVEMLCQLRDRFGCRVLEGYGLSETSPAASFNHPDRPTKVGSIGTPVWGTEMRIAENSIELSTGEIGEIQVRGHNVMSGYFNKPEETKAAFELDGRWFKTGDLGYVDTDGYFFVVDRKKDLIIRNGYNVYPREVEEVLYKHPSVLEAAVVGAPHATLGEEIVAVLAVRPGHPFDAPELQRWCKQHLAPYKYPRIIIETDFLPKGPTGKILKRAIQVPECAAPRSIR
ncbi:MAG: long-chain fatty acid--CoA ligase [Mycobacterium sp.]